MHILQIRTYHLEFTQSELFINGFLASRYCYVLEDKQQPYGTKIPGETCIPEGTYTVTISKSTRFGKDMMHLANTQEGKVARDGAIFTGIRPHGGNSIEDTAGCPILARHTNNNGQVWSSMSGKLQAKVQEALLLGEEVLWTITSI